MGEVLDTAAALESVLARGSPAWQLRSSPTLRLGQQTVMPAMAGWLTSRVPRTGSSAPLLAPHWVAEILSYRCERLDRLAHLPSYAATGVQFVWLIDPGSRTLTVLRRVGRAWQVLRSHAEDDRVQAEPFDLTLELGRLWPGPRPRE